MPRRIGAFTAGCVLVSNVVGVGIFTTTGIMARDLGNPFWILGLWLMGALLALGGALAYSELGTALPHSGGEYVFLRQAYGPLAGFLSGWTSLAIGFGAAIAAGAVSFAAYLRAIVPLAEAPETLSTALSLTWLVTGFHLSGHGASGAFQRLLTSLNVGLIAALVLLALTSERGSWEHLLARGPETPPGGTIAVSLIFVGYAYSGWNAAAYLSGELVEPGRTIPRALIGGTLAVAVLYLGLNLVYFYALPVAALGQAPVLPVAEKAAMALFGPGGATVIGGIVCLSIAGSVSAMIWAGSRLYHTMAVDGLLPGLFARLSPRSGIPLNAVLLQGVWASLLILSGTFEALVVYSGFVLTAFNALAVGAVLVLRWRRPDMARPYRVPLYPLVPVLYVGCAGAVAAYTAVERPVESGLGLVTVLAGVPLYFRLSQRSRG
ncbi:MAG: amino acid permease [Nitrospirota bacterium]